jgi:hypothetical protein
LGGDRRRPRDASARNDQAADPASVAPRRCAAARSRYGPVGGKSTGRRDHSQGCAAACFGYLLRISEVSSAVDQTIHQALGRAAAARGQAKAEVSGHYATVLVRLAHPKIPTRVAHAKQRGRGVLGLLRFHDLPTHFATRVRRRVNIKVGLSGHQRLGLIIGQRGRALEGAGRDAGGRYKHACLLPFSAGPRK